MRQRQLPKLLNRIEDCSGTARSPEAAMGQAQPALCKFLLTVPLMVYNLDCSVLATLGVLLTLHWFETHRGCMTQTSSHLCLRVVRPMSEHVLIRILIADD
jgi:hypothetical protein